MNVQLFWALMLIITMVAYFSVLIIGDMQVTQQILAAGVSTKAPRHRGQRSMCDAQVEMGTGKHRKA